MSQHPSAATTYPWGRRHRPCPWLCAAILALVVTAWIGDSPGPRSVEAQQPRSQRGEKSARTRIEYSQAVCLYTQMADLLNEREAKGWETFEIVPVHPANPGVGGTMRVAIVFRRPAQ
jgi:hypothetical protein